MTNDVTQTRKEQKKQERENKLWDIMHRKLTLNGEGVDCVSLTDESDMQGDRGLLNRLQYFGDRVKYNVGISHAKPIRDVTGQGNFTYEAEHYEPKYSVRVKKIGQKKAWGEKGLDCFGDYVIELFDDRGDNYSGRYLGVKHFSESATRFAYRYAFELAQELSTELKMPLVDDTWKGWKKALKEKKDEQ